MKKIKYFYTESCPFCVKPKEFIEENRMDIELVDATRDSEARAEILEKGGKMQVPLLLIGDQAMYESQDILIWLKENI